MPTSPSPTHVAVVIPARDERNRLTRCLDRVLDALDVLPVPGGVVVVDHRSTDGTGDVVRAIAATDDRVELLHSSAETLAGARDDGFRAAIERYGMDAWIASTDADTVVPQNWIRDQLVHARAGVVAVAGTVRLLRSPRSAALRNQWWADYARNFSPDGTHPHVHAANLGISAAAYVRCGGFPRHVVRAEDIALWQQLRLNGMHPIADASIAVSTSARPDARQQGGFGAALLQLYGVPTP